MACGTHEGKVTIGKIFFHGLLLALTVTLSAVALVRLRDIGSKLDSITATPSWHS
jgi:hypothetical protein